MITQYLWLGIFSMKLKYFSKEIIFNGSLGKTKYYAKRIEFQERNSPHVHLFVWIFKAPNTENEAAYSEFIRRTINAQPPDHMNYAQLFELVEVYQVYALSRNCWKYNNEWHFSYGWYFTEKTIIAKPGCKFSNVEKQEVLTWRNTLILLK